MTKTLVDRLQTAKSELQKAEAVLVKHADTGKVPPEVATQFGNLAKFEADVDTWIAMLDARAAARRLLTGLENQVDGSDTVPLGTARAKYQYVRLIGMQAYIATKWALADKLIGMAGQIVCTPNVAFNTTQPAQLVTEFLRNDRKKNTSAALYDSTRQTFGWPIAISYALRNHFVHDGGHLNGVNFFDGSTAASGFQISADGWNRIEEKAKSYGVTASNHRVGAIWPTSPRNDLRAILDVCERETDDALGILVASACHALSVHVGYIHGEI